jgi:predicted regulator of Ras-like GTPase activity (Roadblock/LC7/MglB family)
MPFKPLLEQMIHNIVGAEGAILAAYDGEPVVEVLPNNQFQMERYDLQLMAAQLGTVLGRINQMHVHHHIQPLELLIIREDRRTIYLSLLDNQYYVLLSVRKGIGLMHAEHYLRQVSPLLNQAM